MRTLKVILHAQWVLVIVAGICLGTIMACTRTTGSGCIVDVSRPGAAVAPICRGQQVEEFNHQFEGGLYAQLISNPSFEEVDSVGDKTHFLRFWSLVKQGSSEGSLSTATGNLVNSYQTRCLKLNITSVASGDVGAADSGYWGIKLVNNTTYKVSFWAKKDANFAGNLLARLESNDGNPYASFTFKPTTKWAHYTCDLSTSGISNVTGTNRFVIYGTTTGTVYIDVVTLMPPTWKNRPNGCRPDLAMVLDSLKLKYLQFPGGAATGGLNLSESWYWKGSIGPIEERSPVKENIWKYGNDHFFGLDEYLQLAEDLGAEPVYTTMAGIIPYLNGVRSLYNNIDSMKAIITDILDLIEYCNGGSGTIFGNKRIANGHPAPYNLKYIEIGNECQMDTTFHGNWSQYTTRYTMIHDSIIAHYPDMKIMYNGSHNLYSSSTANGCKMDYTDEHFYPGLTEEHFHRAYGKYDTINSDVGKICVAELANQTQGCAPNEIGNHKDAVRDAVFQLGCEKNSARMWWTGYGNYAGLVGHGDYGPCLIWNDAVSYFCTPSYYGQKILFSDNPGTQILPFTQNTANCYWSASVDTEAGKNDVLLKVANPTPASESADIILKGVVKVDSKGLSTTLKGAPDDENSLDNPTRVIPTKGNFIAGTNFKYSFPAWSVTVLRIKILKQR
jgi:alpha-L-arabinofuranosidase